MNSSSQRRINLWSALDVAWMIHTNTLQGTMAQWETRNNCVSVKKSLSNYQR